MRILFFISLSLFFSGRCFSQQTREIKGLIVADSIEGREVSIYNLKTMSGTNAQNGGLFDLKVSVGDTLVFSSLNYQPKEVAITKENINDTPFVVNLEPLVFELDEVDLYPGGLTGFLSMDASSIKVTPTPDLTKNDAFDFRKPMSVEDRRIYTAVTSPAGVPLDYLINKWSGRLDMLLRQKTYAEDKRQVSKGIKLVGRSYFTKELNLSPDLVDDFIYFCLDFDLYKKLVRQKDPLKLMDFYTGKIDEYKARRLGDE